MELNFKICSDAKYAAWATWTLISNNPVSKTFYLLLCALDLLIIIFYSFALVERVHYSNFTMGSTEVFGDPKFEAQIKAQSN